MQAVSTGIFFNVNGKDVKEKNFDPELTLGYYLRNKLGLRGTKLGCEEGVCGSCTVVLGTWDEALNRAVYRAVNACLVPLFHVHTTFVITVEGVGSRDKIHPIQDRMARGHAVQCGFCSPGFVMSAYALLRNHPNPTIEQINTAIKGNLCRCTGYRPILEALYSFSDQSGGCCGGNKQGGGCCKDEEVAGTGYDAKLLTFDDFPKYDPTQEIIFPPSLRTYVDSQNIIALKGDRVRLSIPKTLDQFELVKKESHTVISSGLITRLLVAFRPDALTVKWVTTKYVKEFNEIIVTPETVTIGCAVVIQKLSETLSTYLHTNMQPAILDLSKKYSSPQVANFATWTGAVVTAPKALRSVSDITLLFTILDAKLTILTEAGFSLEIKIEEFLQRGLLSGETVVNSIFSRSDNRRLFCFKLGETSEHDSTLFNFAALVGDDSTRAFVGLGGPPKRLTELERHLNERKSIDQSSLLLACGLPVNAYLEKAISRLIEFLKADGDCGGLLENSEPVNYLQFYKPSLNESVGRPIANYFNERTITGEALYINDIKVHDGVHLGFVLSSHAHAEILSIDPTEALELKDVLGYFGVEDVPGMNVPGLSLVNVNFPDDSPVFADKRVESVGQVIGVIAANDVVVARRAAKLVKVAYRPLPALIELEKAIEADSLHCDIMDFGVTEDEVETMFAECDKVLEGEVYAGAQEHYYLETQSSLAVPGEGDEMVIHCSTQGTSFSQLMIAKVLDLKAHKLIVKTKRMGGAFGGKVTSATWIGAMCAIVAQRLKRPVFGHPSRSDDLVMTGKRHPIYAKYKVGIDAEGKVKGAHHKVYVDGGWTKDHTDGVTTVIGIKVDDVYDMGTVRFEGYQVKTNKCSSTSFRGFGNPQAKLINEGVMRRIAHEVNKSTHEIKKLNFNVEGGKNYMGGTIHSDAHTECWQCCELFSEFERRKMEAEEFNRSSKTVKRGVAMSSVRFGLPHTESFGQGVASVLINLDGSVQLSIGGTEMGQGLNQKMMQVCAEALKRPVDTITIVDNSTDKVTNSPETGGSQDTDTNGIAVLACCEKIMSRLQPFVDKHEGDWNTAVMEAFNAFIPLQAIEFGYPNRKQFGVKDDDAAYNTTGACAVEMEVDFLTGYNRVIRVDLVMDVGESLNPAIDIGQIEGAFMQGYGYVTCEKVTYNKETGHLHQNMAGKYKIPKGSDAPKDFRVKLIGVNKSYGAQVYSAKGIGEPPLMMSCGAVHSAVMECIDTYRKENGMHDFVETVSPLSADKILELCFI
ncbi:unnamed protein product [Caenorhabditis sp. 36 PRJEB53466]|nr:unnamed protein product [Caenorhabditis sp. 36 PRJEB53466]